MNKQELHDEAFRQMGSASLDVDERSHFAELTARYDTLAAKAKRQARSREKLQRAAEKVGYTSIGKLADAILADLVTVARN